MAPMALMTPDLAFASPLMLSIAMIWLAHIGIDRALGYGLKYRPGLASPISAGSAGTRTTKV